MELKQLIRKKREELKLSQKQASALLHVSTLTWVSWERGQIPTIKHLFLIADWLETTVDALRPLIPGCERKLSDIEQNDEHRGK